MNFFKNLKGVFKTPEWLKNSTATVQKAAEKTVEKSVDVTKKTVEVTKKVAEKTVDVAQKLVEKSADITKKAFDKSADVTQKIFDKTPDVVKKTVDIVQKTADSTWKAVEKTVDFAAKAVDVAQRGVETFGSIMTGVNGIITGIKSFKKNTASKTDNLVSKFMVSNDMIDEDDVSATPSEEEKSFAPLANFSTTKDNFVDKIVDGAHKVIDDIRSDSRETSENIQPNLNVEDVQTSFNYVVNDASYVADGVEDGAIETETVQVIDELVETVRDAIDQSLPSLDELVENPAEVGAYFSEAEVDYIEDITNIAFVPVSDLLPTNPELPHHM